MKKFSTLVTAAVFAALAASTALAQTSAPAVMPKPAEASPAPAAPAVAKPAKMTAAEKAALSKKCSADADAKKLHGKERQKFRNACKTGKV